MEVADAQLQPPRAVRDKVTAALTLVKRRPVPLCGLSDSNRVRLGLDGPVGGDRHERRFLVTDTPHSGYAGGARWGSV